MSTEEKENLCKAFLEYDKLFMSEGSESETDMKITYRKKSELIRKVHTKKNGTPRAITPPTEEDGFWYTRLPNGNKVRAVTEEALFDKLLNFYAYPGANTFGYIFEQAISLKELQRSSNTVNKYRKDYKRFIDSSLAQMDVTRINKPYLNKYTTKMLSARFDKQTNTYTTKEKAYRSYVGVLNLVFNYAIDEEIINFNPASRLKFDDYANLVDCTAPTAEQKAMSPETVKKLKKIVNDRLLSYEAKNEFYVNGYMFLMSTLTGMRAAELCSLKWEDIKDGKMYIHSQQLKDSVTKTYTYAPWTKNDRRHTGRGRYISLYSELNDLVERIRKYSYGNSEFVFAHEDGSWIKKDLQYEKFLLRLCKSNGSPVTNNHSIRMYFNSYVLIPLGVTVPNRAAWLGHSIRTNLDHYSFPDTSYSDEISSMIDNEKKLYNEEEMPILQASLPQNAQVTQGDPNNIIDFSKIKKPRVI